MGPQPGDVIWRCCTLSISLATLIQLHSRHDKDGDGKLTFKEIWAATETNKNWLDAVLFLSCSQTCDTTV
jgi:hypothetical protein